MRRDSEALKIRTKDFALRVLRLYRSLPRTDEARILGKQLLRSSTSIGANYRAACRGRSRAEFLAKLGIVLEEADETVFWLELLQEGNVFPAEKLRELVLEANELVSIFVSSVRTAKANAEDRSDCRGERAKSDCRGQIAEVKEQSQIAEVRLQR